MNFSNVNFFAIFVAALSSFMLGGIWYSKALFKDAWLESCGLTELDLKSANINFIFGFGFVFAYLAAFVFALFLGADAGIAEGVGTGFAIGFFWVSTSFGLTYLFEQRPIKLFLINCGYYILRFSLMGLILGGWP